MEISEATGTEKELESGDSKEFLPFSFLWSLS